MYPAYFKVDHEEIEDKIKSLKEQLRNIPIKKFLLCTKKQNIFMIKYRKR